ncbi:MAG: PKD domain-containing protein [Chloroflexi bacterium]|nr:PKD domain-containing protein [Chloroflexota bacterium]
MTKKLALVLTALTFSVQIACSPPQPPAPPAIEQQNHAPTIEKINYDKSTYHNRPAKIECIASDIDNDNLTYLWEAKDGKITGEGKSVEWIPPGNMRTYPITLTVTDGRGGEVKKTVYIMVVTNADGTNTPNIEVKLKLGDNSTVIIENQRVRIWTTANILCIVENAKESELLYTWSADGGRIQGEGVEDGKANKISWIAPGTQSDITVDVRVTGVQQGSEAKGQIKFKVYCCGKELTED